MRNNPTERRGKREQKPSLANRLFNIILVATISITSVAVGISGLANALAADMADGRNSESTMLAMPANVSARVEGITPLLNTAPLVVETTPIIEEEESIGVYTSRLGVYVNSYIEDVDYTSLMLNALNEAIGADDPTYALATAEIYEEQRNLKIMDIDPTQETYQPSHNFQITNSLEVINEIYYPKPSYYLPYTEEELIAAARIVYAESGSDFITDEHQQAVASVLVNRVYDGRFGTGIIGVINREGQYPTRYNKIYTERTLENARIVFENGPTHNGLYQSNSRNGTELVMTFGTYGGRVGTTYICR